MAIVTVTGLTAARMEAMEDDQVISGAISGDNLILTKRGGATVNAGNVRGPQGLYGAPQLVSTLPPAPANGDEVYFQNSTMAADGFIWHLRYRSGSPSAYKWEVISAQPVIINNNVPDINVPSTGWLDPTNMPTFTLPLAGDYNIGYGAQLVPPAASYNGVSIWNAAGTTHYTYGAYFNNGGSASSTADIDVWKEQRILNMPAGNYKMRYIQTVANGQVGRKGVTYQPIRVG